MKKVSLISVLVLTFTVLTSCVKDTLYCSTARLENALPYVVNVRLNHFLRYDEATSSWIEGDTLAVLNTNDAIEAEDCSKGKANERIFYGYYGSDSIWIQFNDSVTALYTVNDPVPFNPIFKEGYQVEDDSKYHSTFTYTLTEQDYQNALEQCGYAK